MKQHQKAHRDNSLVVELKFIGSPTEDSELVLLVKGANLKGADHFLSELAQVAGRHACTVSARFKSP